MNCSVLIPTVGRKSLEVVLASLQRQTELPLEVILADDGGTIRDKLRTPSAFDLSIVSVPNSTGAARARNMALERCKGDVVLFIDDDIVADEGLVHAHLEAHRKHNSVAAIGFRRRVPFCTWTTKPSAEWLSDSLDDVRVAAVDGPDWQAHWWAFFQTCNASAGTASVREVGGFDEGFVGWGFEDTDLGYRLCRAGLKVHPVLAPIPFHLDPPYDVERTRHQNQSYLRNARRFQQKWVQDRALHLLVEGDIWRRTIAQEEENSQ